MEKAEILKKVIAKLEQMKQEELEEVLASLDQKKLDKLILQIKTLKTPEKVKELVISFDDQNNPNEEQQPRLELLNEIKKNDLFRISGLNMIKGMDEMWHRLVNKEWKIPYNFGSL